MFVHKWLESVSDKGSLLCAGLDPLSADAGQEYGIPLTDDGGRSNIQSWSLAYLEAVAPHVSAVKFNSKHWYAHEDELCSLIAYCKAQKLPIIQDSKFADIGSTNDAGLYRAQVRGVDAVTIAPYAGNLSATALKAKARGLDVFSMCLMSNPEFAREKEALVPLRSEEVSDFGNDAIRVGRNYYVKRYLKSAQEAKDCSAAGVVIGATGHITAEEITLARNYLTPETLVLMPGMGAQGGDITTLASVFPGDNIIASVGRALMFPKGSASTPADQAEAARTLKDYLNAQT